jgi:hypothetical protein
LPNAKNGVWPCKDAWFGPIGSKVATNAIVSQIFECYYRYKEIDGSGMGTLEKEQDKWIPLAPQAAAEGRLYRFNANGLRTVRGDGEYHRIPVDSLDSEATPGYITTPVAYQGVFLQSELKNPFAEPLLEGVGRVFLDSEYIGETRVTGADVGKSLTIPLGEDPQVTVKRMILQNVFAGSKESKLRTLNVDIKIEVVNNRKTPAQIKIMDRLATTVDTRARLRKPVLSGGTKQELHEDGIALWYGVVTPGGNLLVNGHYEVEYPVGVIPQAVSEDGYDDDEEYAEDDDGMDW